MIPDISILTNKDPLSFCKKCTKCGIVKLKTAFGKQKDKKSGLRSNCYDCREKANLKRQKEIKRLRNAGNSGFQVPESKRCAVCGEVRPSSAFYKSDRAVCGLTRLCKGCSAGETRARKEKYFESTRLYNAKYHATKRGHASPDITPAAFKKMRMLHSGICDMTDCHNIATDLDHCHATGRVRGLLCNNCNIALGWFEKIRPRSQAFLAYLQEETMDE